MKKIALLSVAAAALALPAVAMAADEAMTHATTTAGASAAHKVELKDGSWAEVTGDSVKVSKDGGKTWSAAPDGTWETKEGSKITTKDGKKV